MQSESFIGKESPRQSADSESLCMSDSEFPKPTFLLRVARFLRLYRTPLLYALLLELRSFYWRILHLHENLRDCLSAEMGQVFEEGKFGVVLSNTRTHARIAGTQSLYARFPSATGWDVNVFLLGWKEAEQYIRDRTNNECEEPERASVNSPQK